jgi:transposase
MSILELKRAGVLARVKVGEITLRQASVLMRVSYRHAKRLWRRFRRRGPAGLQHGNAGRRSNRQTPAAVRRRVLALVRREFGGDATHARFGPTLAAEHLAEEYGLAVHHETLRRWMRAAGLWSPVRNAPPHRKRRVRKAHFGELVQVDGSFEHWLEDRGPRACLMPLIDDATGRCVLRFEPQETIWGAVRVLRAWIAAYGIPHALYTDWKNVYVRKPTEGELASGVPGHTQFGRMCATLGIRVIAASSPQAKGRVERGHGTHQDRLIKKLRRQRIADYDAANAFVTADYTADHNDRFARPPAAPEDFHTAVPGALDLNHVFRLETSRTVYNDWVVRHDNRLLQLDRQGRFYPPARSTVRVCEYEDGHLEVWYRGARVPWTDVTGSAPRAVPRPRGVTPPAPPPRAARPIPAPTHPWRQRYDRLHDGVSPGERIPGRPGAWLIAPAASADPAQPVRGLLGGHAAQPK